jgi:L-ascorbate metabolism protein UlaG (beta-lactamase superfamily)
MTINTVYTFESEGLKLCHLGDLNRMLLSQQVQRLGQIDVLFVPAGALDSLSPARAAEVVVQLAPMIVIPMHYQLDGLPEGFAPVDGFLSALGTSAPSRESKLNITTTTMPREQRVVLLDRVFSGVQSKLTL